MSVLIDTSAFLALLDESDHQHAAALRYWDSSTEELVAHNYVVVETIALVRTRLKWPFVARLIDDVLPAIRVEYVERDLHDAALAIYREQAGGTSFVDRVTLEFGRRAQITHAFAFDRDLVTGGLPFPAVDRGEEASE